MTEERTERIERENREYDIYGRPIMQRWSQHNVTHSYSTRGIRAKATRLGKWLCSQEALAWLERFGISVDDFLDITCEIRSRDDRVVKVETTVSCGRNGYTWKVLAPERFPDPT